MLAHLLGRTCAVTHKNLLQDALQVSRSTMTEGMDNWLRHAAVARPVGPAPTINNVTSSIEKTRVGKVVGLWCGVVGDLV